MRGNPVCALAGSQELLKAALPGLAVLNGRRVAQQEPTLAPAALQQQPQQFEGPHTDSQSAQGDRGYDDMGRLPTFSPRALPSTAAGASRGPQDGAVPWPGSTSSWPDDREVQGRYLGAYAGQHPGAASQGMPGPMGNTPSPVQLAADFEALLAEHTSLSQRATSLEASLQAAEVTHCGARSCGISLHPQEILRTLHHH